MFKVGDWVRLINNSTVFRDIERHRSYEVISTDVIKYGTNKSSSAQVISIRTGSRFIKGDEELYYFASHFEIDKKLCREIRLASIGI